MGRTARCILFLSIKYTENWFEEGVYANPVVPPATPPGQGLIRTTYTATHKKEELEEAADIIAKVFAEFDLIEK